VTWLSVELIKLGEKGGVVVQTPSFLVSKVVCYERLWNARRRAYRNGKWRSLKDEDKGLLNSAIGYLKLGCRIVSATVIARLRVVMKKLGIANRTRVLLDGETKAMEMRTQYEERGVFKWVPQLKTWLNDVAYKVWLGMIQVSLEGFYTITDPSWSEKEAEVEDDGKKKHSLER
jgi:hypothetical protein